MKQHLANIYAKLTQYTWEEWVWAVGFMIICFVLISIPTDIYFSNSKYFGDPNDKYAWMCYTSIGLASAFLLGVFTWLGINTVKND